jgi:hypothetical protein
MHQATGNLNQPRHQTAVSRPQRDATHDEEANLSKINRAAGLVAKSEWPAGDNDWTFKSQRMLSAKGDGKIYGERINALVHLFRDLCGSSRARCRHLCALAWRHLCTTC